MKQLSLIFATSKNGVIAKGGNIPWRCPPDMAYFKEKTTGHAVVMGRKTAESLPFPLPNRHNIVLTKNPDFNGEGFIIAHSAEQALSLAYERDENPFIIGGAEIYKMFMPQVTNLHRTIVKTCTLGVDLTYYDYNPNIFDEWMIINCITHDSFDEKKPGCLIHEYRRR